MARMAQRIGWATFALVSAYAVALSGFALLNPGWKPHRVETAWFLFGFAFLFGLCGLVRSNHPPATAAPPVEPAWWGAALAAAVGAVAYSGGLTVGYLSDDFVLLELADPWRGWRQGETQLVRMLPVALLQIFDTLGPPGGALVSHAVSLALHVTNGVLLFAIARRLSLTVTASTLAAMLFVLYPASPEAVVWASGLQDVLMATATLAFVLAALDGRHALVLVGCLLVGLLSKETAVAMPLVGAGALWARGTRPRAAVTWTIAACIAVVLAFGAWRVIVGGGAFAVRPTRFLVKEIVAGAFGVLAFPWTSGELRHAAPLGALMVAVVTLAAWIVLGARAWFPVPRVAVLGVTWVIAGVAPVYSLFFVSDTLEGSRYLYLPSAGWALSLAAAASVVSRPARVFRGLAGIVVAVWGLSAYGHGGAWQHAAAERDRIVAAARAVSAPECSGIVFARATDNVEGAYVFRNGLNPALRRAGLTTVVDVAGSGTCVFTWTGDAFTRTR